MQGHLSQEPRPPRELNAGISPSLDHLIRKLLSKSPGDRYNSATQVRRILQELLAGDK
jgi:serine/threonine-protein kinase